MLALLLKPTFGLMLDFVPTLLGGTCLQTIGMEYPSFHHLRTYRQSK